MTGLTVPVAGIEPGRAARAGQIVPDAGGDALAEFGKTMAAVGNAVESDRLDRQLKRAQVDMTRDLNNLRLEAMQIGSPDEADRVWNEGKARIRNGFMQPGVDGKLRIDAKNVERFDLLFDDLANRHEYSLGARGIELRNAERQATFMAYTHEAAQVYATGDDEVRSATLADLDAAVDEDVAAGRIDAAEGQKRKMEFRAQGDNARAIRMISDDPRGFQAALDAGEFGNLPEGTRARYSVQATNAVAAQDKAVATEVEKQARARSKVLGDRLTEIRKIAGAGAQAVDEAFLTDPEVMAHPEYGETMAALSLRDEGKLIEQMSPRELREQIASEKSGSKSHAYQTERLTLLERTLADHEEGYAGDAVAYAQSNGLDVPPWPGADLSSPGRLADTLQARGEWARQQVAQGYVSDPVVMSDAERTQLSEVAGKTAHPDARLALSKELIAGLGADAAIIEAQAISNDPTFGWVTSLVGQGAPDSTARAILDGQSKIAQKTVTAPSRSDAIEIFHAVTDGEFRDLNDLTAGVLNSALAIYAHDMPDGDPGAIDEDKFEEAIQRALGASTDSSGTLTVGGLQTIDPPGWGNEHSVPLPVNVPRRSVEAGMGAIADELSEGLRSVDRDGQGGAIGIPQRVLAGVSLTGALPDFGDPESDGYDPAGIWSQLRLEAYWPDGQPRDHYLLYRMRAGRKAYLQDINGQPFQMSLKQLVRATR